MLSQRTSWQVTRSVWHALFMREALARTTADRMAWFWMLFEPIATVLILVAIRAVILNGRQIAGADFIAWLIVGLFGFYLFRENMMRSIGAIDANKALFAYRQVKPIDPVFVRCYLEGMLKSFVFLIFILGGSLVNIDLIPDRPLGALIAWLSLWALGAGAGVLLSVLASLVPEIGKIVRLLSLPLLIISGVIFPIQALPHYLQEYLLFNPIVHGIETLRESFFSSYKAVNGISLDYLWLCTLAFWALGLSLHIKFSNRVKAQ